jgi:hypothetical protein
MTFHWRSHRISFTGYDELKPSLTQSRLSVSLMLTGNSLFEHARAAFAGDPDMELYIGQTIPIMQAHLEMAKGIQRHLSESSPQSPANNKNK